MELYILNKKFDTVAIINSYKSVIWAKRYLENGDCELVIPIGEVKEKRGGYTGITGNVQSAYFDVCDYSELYLSNNNIPRTGQNPGHLIMYPYIGGIEQDYINIDNQLDNGTAIDVSSYDGIKFKVLYSGVNYAFDYKLKSNGILDVIKMGYYIVRNDDDMVCMIKDLTIETDRDSGDKVTVKAYDVKSVIDQRYTKYDFGFSTYGGSLPDVEYPITMLGNALNLNVVKGDRLYNPKNNRAVENCNETVYSDLPTVNMQIERELGMCGEIMRKYASTYNVGYKFVIYQKTSDGSWWFIPKFYTGSDKTNTVIFSEEFNDLVTSKYSISYNNSANACMVKTSDSEKPTVFTYPDETGTFDGTIGGWTINDGGTTRNIGKDGPKGLDRFETNFDSDIAFRPDYETLRDSLYPGGTLTTNAAGTEGEYKVSNLKIECVTPDFKMWLQQHFSGSVTVENDTEYFTCSSAVKVATLTRTANTESWNVMMEGVAIFAQLWNAGKKAVIEKVPAETFEGTVVPNGQFTYKEDYDLGDVVRIENKYGISADARIVEVIESVDENGENLSLTFENKNIKIA